MPRTGYPRHILLSVGMHAALGGLLAGFSLYHGCAGRAPEMDNQPVELIVEVPDFGQTEPEAAPQPAVTPSEPEVKPAGPEPEIKPDETPKPPPDPDDIAEPVPEKKKPEKPVAVKKAEPKKDASGKPKVEVSKKRVVRSSLPKATTTRKSTLTPEEIAKALARGAKAGKKSSLSDADLRRMLTTDMKFGNGRAVDQETLYFEMVRQILYRSWDQPGSLGVVGLTTRVELTLTPDGTIQASRIVGASGNATMDDSVMQAVRSVRRLNGVPSDFLSSHRRITVAFELTGGG